MQIRRSPEVPSDLVVTTKLFLKPCRNETIPASLQYPELGAGMSRAGENGEMMALR